MDTTLKEWITRPEIEKMFWISSQTFHAWASKGKFGDPIGTVPTRSGKGRPLFMYSMSRVLSVYELEYMAVAARAVAAGADPSAFPEYVTFAESNAMPTFTEERVQPVVVWMWCDPSTDMWGLYSGELFADAGFDSDIDPYYDGLPRIINLDNIDKSAIPDKPDLWECSDILLCPPFAGISIAL